MQLLEIIYNETRLILKEATVLEIVFKTLPYLSQEKHSIWMWTDSTAEKTDFAQSNLSM